MVILMEKYVNEIPLLVRNSIKALCDENRQGILIYLLKNGSKSFIEISKDLKIPKNNLSHHIKILMRYALIYNFYNRNEFADKYSFYEISKLGKTIINNVINLIIPLKSDKEDFLFDTTMDKVTVEELSSDADVSVAIWTVYTQPEILGYMVGTSDIIDASTGFEIPSIKSLEDELNTLS